MAAIAIALAKLTIQLFALLALFFLYLFPLSCGTPSATPVRTWWAVKNKLENYKMSIKMRSADDTPRKPGESSAIKRLVRAVVYTPGDWSAIFTGAYY